MNILLGYSYYQYPVDVRTTVEQWAGRLRTKGFNITPVPLTLNYPGPRLTWKELDKRWKHGDRELLALYEKIGMLSTQHDVFLNWNGINMHPEFVQSLGTFNVYGCFDDPESSDNLSKPVAYAHDLCMIGNIAEVDTYRSWGVRDVEFWPMGFFDHEADHSLNEEALLHEKRNTDITLVCERTSNWRKDRLEKYSLAFPQAKFYGAGWKAGFISQEDKMKLYRDTRIGPNFHNSTGPINYRTYTLPANGAMLLCDNKAHLGKIFELNKEAVGFDTVEEAIELSNYYLNNEEERLKIAVAGWKRAHKDYNETAVFQRLVSEVQKRITKKVKSHTAQTILIEHKRATKFRRMVTPVLNMVQYGRDQFYLFRKRLKLTD